MAWRCNPSDGVHDPSTSQLLKASPSPTDCALGSVASVSILSLDRFASGDMMSADFRALSLWQLLAVK